MPMPFDLWSGASLASLAGFAPTLNQPPRAVPQTRFCCDENSCPYCNRQPASAANPSAVVTSLQHWLDLNA
jgi:hypothetical protein